MFSFLFIDAISGFVRVYLGLTNPLFNIGYWVRGPIVILFFFYYGYKLFNRNKLYFDEVISLIIFLFFIFNATFNYGIHLSTNMLISDITYILRLQFLFFLFVFLKNRMTLSLTLTKKVIQLNFITFVLSLMAGFFFGFGLEAYRFEGTSKGMFQGGNPVSILNLVFFTYFLLDGNLRRKLIPVLFTVLNAFIIASKSVFGFIFPIFFALKRRALSLNKIMIYNIIAILGIFCLTFMLENAKDMYENRFGLNINKSIAAAEKVGGLYKNDTMNKIASINFRRYASLNTQMKESFSNSKVFLIGTSFSGQNLFWQQRGEFWFTNCSMDFFDFFFKYGIIGIFLLIFFLCRGLIPSMLKASSRDNIAILLFLGYSFFGGHVIDSVTSGSLFYYLLAKMKSE
jgi:hypothetical protein|tara:strand:+ start:4352 stop:5548 length:1197 start_codon:yes stop_codon:yes gene_type:complete